MEFTNNVKKSSYEECEQQPLIIIADLLKTIEYGYIQITIHDGKVVQIDKTEKFRFNVRKSK